MPDCFPEGNAASVNSDTRRSWIKMNALGPSSGSGGTAITLDDESTAITLDDETTALVIS